MGKHQAKYHSLSMCQASPLKNNLPSYYYFPNLSGHSQVTQSETCVTLVCCGEKAFIYLRHEQLFVLDSVHFEIIKAIVLKF